MRKRGGAGNQEQRQEMGWDLFCQTSSIFSGNPHSYTCICSIGEFFSGCCLVRPLLAAPSVALFPPRVLTGWKDAANRLWVAMLRSARDDSGEKVMKLLSLMSLVLSTTTTAIAFELMLVHRVTRIGIVVDAGMAMGCEHIYQLLECFFAEAASSVGQRGGRSLTVRWESFPFAPKCIVTCYRC